MLDGQGCLLPVRHFQREEPTLMLSSWSSGGYPTCRAEASTESNTSPNPLPHCTRITESCPSSPSAEVERDPNHGKLLELSISRSCHYSLAPLVGSGELRKDDVDSKLANENDLPCDPLNLDSFPTEPGLRVPSFFSFLPAPGLERSHKLNRTSDDEHDGIATGHSAPSDFDLTTSKSNRSMRGERQSKNALDENRQCTGYSEPPSLDEENHFPKNKRNKGEDGDCEAIECLCIWTGAETSCNPSRSRAEDNCSGVLRKFSKTSDTNDNFLRLSCAGTICTLSNQKEGDYSGTKNVGIMSYNDSSLKYAMEEENMLSLVFVDKSIRKQSGTNNATEEGHISLSGTSVTHVQFDSSDPQQYLPGLNNELALRCFAFVPIYAFGRLSRVGRQYRDLIRSREILNLRRTFGMVEHLVFIYTSGPSGWTVYDAARDVWKTLATPKVGPAFDLSDRESLSAGAHVLWFGKDVFEFVYYRYDLLTNSWEKGDPMINPRCLFASASCGEFAYVAGGFGPADSTGALKLLNSAERYNSLTGQWEYLPPMSVPRQKCSGFFMDGKFYVIGGKDADHQPIMSGEEYNPSTGMWRTIPNMYFEPEIHRDKLYEPSPPLVAVVNNELYAVENTTNALKIYNKQNNTWNNLGYLPVPTDFCNGWGVAFKALGDRLFVMGDLEGIAACSWKPEQSPSEPVWQLLSHKERGVNSFLFNCAVMNC